MAKIIIQLIEHIILYFNILWNFFGGGVGFRNWEHCLETDFKRNRKYHCKEETLDVLLMSSFTEYQKLQKERKRRKKKKREDTTKEIVKDDFLGSKHLRWQALTEHNMNRKSLPQDTSLRTEKQEKQEWTPKVTRGKKQMSYKGLTGCN